MARPRFSMRDLLSSAIAAMAVAFIALAITVSGKTGVNAAQFILFLACIVAVYGVWQSRWAKTWARFLVASILIVLVMTSIAAWARPDAVPVYFGELKARRQLVFSPGDKKYITVEIGDSGMELLFQSGTGIAVLEFARDNHLSVEKIDGRLRVSTQIRDRTGNVVVELLRNEWKVSPPPNTWDRNYTDDALEVKDARGRIVLQIQMLSDRIRLQGEWWNKECGVRIVSTKMPTTGGNAGAFVFLRQTNDPDTPRIEPIFEYPSDTHFGELHKSKN